MRNAIVKLKKTGHVGHIFNFHDDVIDPKKEYSARFPGSGQCLRITKGSELEFIRGNWEAETIEMVRLAYLSFMKRRSKGQLQIF